MFSPEICALPFVISSVTSGTQPVAAQGTAVTPGNLTYGSYAQLLTATSDDSCEVEIGINTVGIAATARDCLVTIGWDPAGGTSYGVTARTSIDHLLGSCASAYMGGTSGIGGGVVYRFPLRIPAGATVAAKAMVNSATVTALNVWIKLRCRPTAEHNLWVGSYVDTYGANTGAAAGTAITPGTAAKGAYVALGTLTDVYSYWEFGIGCNDLTMSNLGYEVDLAVGDGSNKIVVIDAAAVTVANIETITKPGGHGRFFTAGPLGTTQVFGRAQCSGTPDSNVSMIAYAVGG